LSHPGRAAVLLYLLLIFHHIFDCLPANAQPEPYADLDHISAIVNELRTALGMTQDIQVTVAASNERMVSVERVSGNKEANGVFNLCFDEGFLASLDAQELRAAIAHELGHVWIFSHHPYLQTEALANEIAMKVVSRDSLKKIYRKLWVHLGTEGNLEEFLGADSN
jgi:hypothetical protein